MAGTFMPPNGFAGLAQQTSAVQSLYRKGRGGSKRRRKSATKKVARTAKRRVRRAAAGKAKRLVKGSAAAKRYMSKIRKMRKK